MALLAALHVLVLGCAEGSFGGASGKDGKGKPVAAGKTESGGEALGTSAEGDRENEEADEPAMVAGSFLWCVEDDQLPGSSADTAAAGCALKDADGKLSLTGLDQVTWTLLDAVNQDMHAGFTTLGDGGPHHASVLVTRKDLAMVRVRLEVARGATTNTYVAAIAPKGAAVNPNGPEIPASVPPPEGTQLKEFGAVGDFRLGDGRFSQGWNRGCVQALQRVELSGKRMTIGFKVEKPGLVIGVTLREMCGVSVKTNYVALLRDGVEVAKIVLPVEGRELALPGFAPMPGNYSIVVRSLFNSQTNDFDDFVVGRVTFTYRGGENDILFSQPVAAAD